jgi:hypothetical protein
MVLAAAMVLAGGTMVGVVVGSDAPSTAPGAVAVASNSPLYTEVVKDYMEGRWDVVEKTLKEKLKELGQLSTEEQAAVATIRLAVKGGK